MQPNQPQAQDVVLGGQSSISAPTSGLVLGGIAGVQHRFKQGNIEHRIAAVYEANRYGDAGLEVLLSALNDSCLSVQKAAYLLLEGRSNSRIQKHLRQFEVYPLFECLYTLRGHVGEITAVAVSADGQLVISAGRDATLRVWDLQAKEVVWTIPIWQRVQAIAISPDNRTFAVTTQPPGPHPIQAWDCRTQQELDPEFIPNLPTRSIASVALSPDRHKTATHLISGSQNSIKIWNLQAGREVCTLEGHDRQVTSVALCRNFPLLVSGSADKTVRIWGIA